MVRQRHARFTIAFADKAAFPAQAKRYIAVVADDNALQAKQFVEIDGAASGFSDRLAPALDTILRRVFAFDLEDRAGAIMKNSNFP